MAACIVRAILGLINAYAMVAFGRSVQRAFGTGAGIWYALFQASQFHVIYYASRTLPNMFALVFSKFKFPLLLKPLC
jgi:alpha-1,6-mannosyltransferase